MINIQKIKARIVELGMNQKQAAEAMGMSLSTFNLKLNTTSKRQFSIGEFLKLVKVLNIEKPQEYFL